MKVLTALIAIAFELSRDGAGGNADGRSDLAQRDTLPIQAKDGVSLLRSQMFVFHHYNNKNKRLTLHSVWLATQSAFSYPGVALLLDISRSCVDQQAERLWGRAHRPIY